MAGLIGTNLITQVGFVVRDIETTKRKFAEFFGVDVPNHFDAGKFEVTGTNLRGAPAPDANCFMAFFDIGPGIQLELIQPNDAPSTWREFLDEKGEGIHHIAFGVKDMDEKVAACEAAGMECVMRGKYGNAGGEYAYIDASKDLKCMLEMLESY